MVRQNTVSASNASGSEENDMKDTCVEIIQGIFNLSIVNG